MLFSQKKKKNVAKIVCSRVNVFNKVVHISVSDSFIKLSQNYYMIYDKLN